MTDLSHILPSFPLGRYAELLPALEKHRVTTTDLLTLDPTDLGKRTQLGLLDLKRLCAAVLEALQVDLGVSDKQEQRTSVLRRDGKTLAGSWSTISTLDASLDRALGGGIPTGHITEIVGESGVGKTQFLLTLLLACQLPPPYGLGRPALYISTEAALSTVRLSQILRNNPFFQSLDKSDRPSLDGVISTSTPDLESQDHILQFQVPVEVPRRNVGLLVLDSVAANYRAEFERGGRGGGAGFNMAARSTELIRLGQLLHELARKHNLAVVVANQVADRFSHSKGVAAPIPMTTPRPAHTTTTTSTTGGVNATGLPVSQDSPLASRSRGPNGPLPVADPTSSAADLVKSSMPEPPPPEDERATPAPPVLLFDHQQRWFTGWGDDPYASEHALKTPSLGLVWSTQVSCRIALLRRPVYGRRRRVADDNDVDDGDDNYDASAALTTTSWRRWMKVVFAPHVPASRQGLEGGVEFEVNMGGLRGVEGRRK